MPQKDRYVPKPGSAAAAQPFEDAEAAWFWFIQAQQARIDGARVVAGQSLVGRPCEPLDILKVLDRLYRSRLLLMEHMLVLRHYGRRMMAPDPRRVKEARAHILWREAMDRMSDVLTSKGIVRPPRNEQWFLDATVYEEAR